MRPRLPHASANYASRGQNSRSSEATPEIERHLRKRGIDYQKQITAAPEKADPDKRARLEAVKRWFHDDWQRIEPKLRTSIVEGISVFLSLFDDNPKVKRLFCQPKECYDSRANADFKYGRPLPFLEKAGSRPVSFSSALR